MIPFKTYITYLLYGISALALFSCDYSAEPENMNSHNLIFPNSGEALMQGNTYLIRWKDDESKTMRIRLLKSGNVLLKISDNALNTGEFNWTIPDTLGISHDYSIKVLSNDNDFIYYESEKLFKLLKPGATSSFTDPRDGQEYKTVKLCGIWWMAENFNYDTIGTYCYYNDPSNCIIFGRLYTLSAAKNASPPGWHLPSDGEWRTLEAYLGLQEKEIYTTGYRGINAGVLLSAQDGVGFNARFSGYLYIRYGNRFYSLNNNTYFWTSTFDEDDSKYWVRQLNSNMGGIERTKMSGGQYAFSVRYIKDKE